MSALELKIPPPLVVALFALAMWAIARFTPPLEALLPYRDFFSRSFLVAGLAVMGLAALYFFRAKTTINPLNPQSSSTLVTTGLYRFSRNPIYLADVLFLLAWAFYMSNVFSFLMILGFVPYLNRFQIEPEERALEKLFGDKYRAYKSEVRRWI